MTEFVDSINSFFFVPLFVLACILAAALASTLVRLRGTPERNASLMLVVLMICYGIALVRPRFGWSDMFSYPPRAIFGIEEALLFNNALVIAFIYGVLFVPLGVAVAVTSKSYKTFAALGLVFPFLIETSQALLGTGRVASILDYFSASAGIFAGIAIFLAVDIAMRKATSTRFPRDVEDSSGATSLPSR